MYILYAFDMSPWVLSSIHIQRSTVTRVIKDNMVIAVFKAIVDMLVIEAILAITDITIQAIMNQEKTQLTNVVSSRSLKLSPTS
jgi:hypothetical protein